MKHLAIFQSIFSARKMKVAELREEIEKRKDLAAGLKVVMLAQLKEELRKESTADRESTTTTPKKSSSAKNTTGVYNIAEDSW